MRRTQTRLMAVPVFSPGDAARAEDCQGRDGAPTAGSSELDDAPGWDYQQWVKFGSQGPKILRAHAGLATGSIR